MRARSFLILSAVTLGVVVVTQVAVERQERPQTMIATGGPMFPGLIDRLGDVSAVVIRGPERTLTIRRSDTGWGLAEYGDYPISAERVRELVSSLVQFERGEPKTTRADRYARLGVEDVDAPGAKSKEVILQTASGDPVAQLIVGTPGSGIGLEGSTFVRIKGDAQAWLGRGTISPSVDARDWADRRLVTVPLADIREVQIAHPDRSTVTVVREGDGASSFRLVELPKGAKLKRPDAAESMAQPFTDLSFDDLARGQEVEFPSGRTITVTVTQMDGGKVVLDLTDRGDGGRWLRFRQDGAPATLPAAGRSLAFKVAAWKMTPVERKLGDLIEPSSGS